jgi:hypothetical protein
MTTLPPEPVADLATFTFITEDGPHWTMEFRRVQTHWVQIDDLGMTDPKTWAEQVEGMVASVKRDGIDGSLYYTAYAAVGSGRVL